MADRRALGPVDRDRLVGLITDALAGWDRAVALWRAGQIAARNRAVAGLAFELARQITEELDAIDWATDTQRVTADEPVDADENAHLAARLLGR